MLGYISMAVQERDELLTVKFLMGNTNSIIIIYLIIPECKGLNDLHIHPAQLLMKGVSDVSGLQYPVIGQNLSFAPTTVQVLHSAGNHWLTLSTVGMKEDTVRVYDSLGAPLPSHTKKQIATLITTNGNSIRIEYAYVQVSTCLIITSDNSNHDVICRDN